MMNVLKKKIITSGKILISLLFLFGVTTKINIQSIQLSLGSFRIDLYVLCVFFVFVSWIIAAEKWRILLHNDLGFFQALKNILISISYATFLPGGQIVGELGKYGHLKNKSSLVAESIISSIAMDKIIGLFGLVIVGFIGVFYSQHVPSVLFTFYGTLLFIFSFLIAFSSFIPKLLLGNQANDEATDKKVMGVKFTKILELFSNKSNIFWSIILSIAYQSIIGIIIFILARSIALRIEFFDLLWISSTVSFLTSIPVSIGGLGVREASFAFFLSFYSIRADLSVTLSILLYSLVIVGAIIGAVFVIIDYFSRIKKPV